MQHKTFAVLAIALWASAAHSQDAAMSSHAVKGVPFSAEVVNETIRVLQDGNRIHHETHGKLFRDSEGRSRRESTTITYGGETFDEIAISDPIQQHFIFLSTQGDKIATVHHVDTAQDAVSKPAQVSNADAKPQSPEAIKQPCHLAQEFEDLGTKMMEGFTVCGMKWTRTIAAGKIGNEMPIVDVREVWVSSELHEVLLSDIDDPQTGHRITRLVNIKRNEPDPALFQIPPDYTVKTQ